MPDIQAGDVEVTANEAQQSRQGQRQGQGQQAMASDVRTGFMRVDELGETHDESAHTHLGRS
ncbi:hypothetical protein [Ammoniphilus sp. CFH 90114]|uniref:hypothetical protein n=1 Tax=Ammoniphilus sp. CFH 90114 TaxID=2493665 RepID=UPI00100F59F5|nr:hypothetical protein [Ammoniphilus sp. CFH 90114]RXT04138.1 hypothetical protein EIZ39_21400 [Ammoniphilus sp. CFH 90114]